MSWNWEILGETGLQFFGKMSASISHELKNVMAIINENAGLLEDLTDMAGKGMPLNPERLKTAADRIMKQIRRGDDIVKGMNRFAHSVDEPLRQADLNDTLGLMATLSKRFASMRGVTLELEPPSRQVPVVTNPFFLQNPHMALPGLRHGIERGRQNRGSGGGKNGNGGTDPIFQASGSGRDRIRNISWRARKGPAPGPEGRAGDS